MCRRVLAPTRTSISSRRDGRGGTALEDRLVAPARIVGPIASHLPNRTVHLIQVAREVATVVHAALRHVHGHDLFRRLVHTEVELAPPSASAPPYAMLTHMPFARAVDLQPGRINDHMVRSPAFVIG